MCLIPWRWNYRPFWASWQGARIWTKVLWESSEHSKLLSYLSSPPLAGFDWSTFIISVARKQPIVFYLVIFKSSSVFDIDEMWPSGAKLWNHVSLSHVMYHFISYLFSSLLPVHLRLYSPISGQFASPFTSVFPSTVSQVLEHISLLGFLFT